MSAGRALVIGGSIGGLFTALLLRRIGWDVAVFERSHSDLSDRGAGIGTRDDLFAILRRLGIAGDRTPAGVRVRSRLCLDRMGNIVAERVVPSINTAWERIYRPLKAMLPDECYCAGMRFERLQQDEAGVTALFADGTREAGDLLVGADGFASSVRQAVLPHVTPLYAGYVCWRGVVEENEMPPEMHARLADHFVFGLPEGELFLSLPMPGREPGERRLYWGWFRPADEVRALPDLCTDETGHCHGTTIPPPLIRRDIIRTLEERARDLLAPDLAELVVRTRQKLVQPIYDLESPTIAVGRVALVGDAAFVARPHVATGVTKAARDAESLADAIEASSDLAAALRRYDGERRPFGTTLVARARALGAYLEASSRGAVLIARSPEELLRDYGAAGAETESVFRSAS